MGLVFFQQAAISETIQKFQSLSAQEKQSACESINSQVMPGISLPCGGVTEQTNESLDVQQSLALSSTTNTLASEQTELLLMERHIPEKGNSNVNNARMADVYTYNYQTDTLNYTLINLVSGQVIQSEQKQSVQLPLTENEINRARFIAKNNQVLHGYLEEEFLKITGQPLQSLDQLVVKAFIFLAKSMPDVVNTASQSCGLHRCARLVMHTSGRIALETSPIIDLSTGIVSQHRTD